MQPDLTQVPEQVPQPVQQPVPPTHTDIPGKTLGIVGFIFAFVFLQIPGLVLSIMSLVKAKRAGFTNNLAIVGIVLNTIFMFVGVGIIAAITTVAYNGITLKANTVMAQSAAASVQKQSELYYADHGSYPISYSLIQPTVDSAAVQATTIITSDPTTPETVEFYSCGTVGNKIGYWDYSNLAINYYYTGSASASTDCTLVTS